MEFTIKNFKESARFNWKIGFALTAYFLLLALVNILFKSELPFIILAWPSYVFAQHKGFAAIVELLFAYVIAVFIVMWLNEFIEKVEHSPKETSEKESSKNNEKENQEEKKLVSSEKAEQKN